MDLATARAIILQILQSCNQFLWGGVMLFLLMGTHLFFTIRLKFVQRLVFRGIRLSTMPSAVDSSHMENTNSREGLRALTTILAATIGIGNIIGLSTAIALGGPGAVFWCWLTGILGMATSYAECYLSLKHRRMNADGTARGGPMYVLEHSLHCRPLGILFAVCTLLASLGLGCMIQSQSAASAISQTFSIPPAITGLVLALPAGFVLIGGSRSISRVCMWLVPAMGLFFLAACFFLLFLNRAYLLPAMGLIVKSAFLPQAAAGGFVGSTLLLAARFGVARGLFTNEAGLGSAPIAAASENNTKNIHQAALISMTAVFWDTIILCAVTGIAIVSHMLRYPESSSLLPPTELTSAAFASIPWLGTPMLALSTLAFSFATILGWYFFGEHALCYLLEKLRTKRKNLNTSRYLKVYQVLYLVIIFLGSLQPVELVWELSDFLNACMALPNLLCLLLLHRQIKSDPD